MKRLTKKQLGRLSEFSANFGLIPVAAIMTPLFQGGTIDLKRVILGIVLTIIFLVISLLLAR